jgi:hypothetical protein
MDRVTSDPRAFFAVDEGAASTSAAIVARLGGRWRLLAAVSFPAAIETVTILALLAERLGAADPDLAAAVGAGDAVERWTRLVVRARPAGRIAVVAGAERAVGPFAAAATLSGWRVSSASSERMDPLAMTGFLLDPRLDVLLVGAGEPPGADERPTLDDLAALVMAVVRRRPEVTVVLGGSMADRAGAFDELGDRAGALALGPAPVDPPSETALRAILDELRAPADDARRAIVRSLGSLADALDRRIEVLEVGVAGGLRAHALPGTGGDPGVVRAAIVASAGLTGEDREDVAVDDLMAWTTIALDRHRLRDRLRELRTAPWGDCSGDGAHLRLAAARAALSRLVELTPDLGALPSPDLLVAAGGAWAVAPGPAIALALADVVRRPGATHLAYDHARLLGPLGAIEDAAERRAIVGDLADELLAPLGSVVMPQGLHPGRPAGRLVVRTESGTTEVELVAGGLELVDLPPGETASAELHFRDTVRLGTRGRTFAVDVAGGLGGLLVDLRDVPMRLPERHDRRRELLAAWQGALWGGGEG